MITTLKSPLTVQEWCKGCGICVVRCPKHVLVLGLGDKVFALYSRECTCCKVYESSCPEQAITVLGDDDKTDAKDSAWAKQD